MQRIEILRIKHATDEILGTPEIKQTLNGKEIYSISKLNVKATATHKHSTERGKQLRVAFDGAKEQTCNPDEEKALQEQYNTDVETLYNEDVPDFKVEIKITFDRAEKIMQCITKSDITNTVIEYLVDEPKP